MTHHDDAHSTSGPDVKIIYFGIILTLLGIGISIYSTMHHLQLEALGQTDFACNINAQFNCDAVAKSQYSRVFGIPLGVWGVAYFAGLLLMLGSALVKPENHKESLQGYVALSVTGVLVSLVLGGISFFVIKAACVSCIGIYLVTFAQLANVWIFRQHIPKPLAWKPISNGVTAAALGVVVVIAGYNFWQPEAAYRNNNLTLDVPGRQQLPPTTDSLLPLKQDIPINRSAYSGLGEDFRKGNDDAKVVIVEFADFQCPACKNNAEIMNTLADEYGDRILVVFKNYPLDQSCNAQIKSKMHEFACQAAMLARCLGEKGNFWKFHDQVYDHQEDINAANLQSWSGLDKTKAAACLESKDVLDKIKDDIALGDKVGVDSTPTVFMNGQKYVGGRSLDAFKQQINKMLNP